MAGTQQSCSVIVLGASGKLGRMVCAGWHPEGLKVVPVVRSGPVPDGGLLWQPGAAIPDIGPVKAVVALWGVTPGPGRDLAQNAHLAVAAMDLGKSLGADLVVHCSSAAVYRPGPNPLREVGASNLQSPYGMAKLEMANTITTRDDPKSPRQVILRIGNVAGAGNLFANMRPRATVTLDRFPNGQGPERSYVTAGDLAKVIEAFIRHPTASGIYTVAAPVPTPMAALVAASGAALTWREALPGAVPRVWLDTSRLSSVLALPERSAEPEYLLDGARVGGVWP